MSKVCLHRTPAAFFLASTDGGSLVHSYFRAEFCSGAAMSKSDLSNEEEYPSCSIANFSCLISVSCKGRQNYPRQVMGLD